MFQKQYSSHSDAIVSQNNIITFIVYIFLNLLYAYKYIYEKTIKKIHLNQSIKHLFYFIQ